MSVYADYGLTPEQYHAGVDRLWDALGLTSVQDTDVFTLANARLTSSAIKLAAAQAEVVQIKGLLETLMDAVDSQLTPNDSVLVLDYCDEGKTRDALAPGK